MNKEEMNEQQIMSVLDEWWASKRLDIKTYIDERLGVDVKGRGFKPPTIIEVDKYVKESGRKWKEGCNAERFINFYESKGWVVGKSKMKNWKSAVGGQWTHKGSAGGHICSLCCEPAVKGNSGGHLCQTHYTQYSESKEFGYTIADFITAFGQKGQDNEN
jgi:hypothetical protein